MTATLSSPVSSRQLPQPVVHRLPSGLTIVAEQIPIEAVNLNIWLNMGSAVESDDINGMAHFLEHMIFKGTARLISGEFEQRIEQRGAITNAATSQDYTHYYITTAPQDFAELAPLQAEVLTNASIPEDGFERERQVVLEEIRRSQDNARRRTFRHAVELTFGELPYRRQVLGPAEVVAQLSADQMRDFHRHWYHPETMTAAVVGNLPVAQLIQIVETSFADAGYAAPRETPIDAIAPTLPPQAPFTTIERVEQTDPALQQARLVMTWRVPGLQQIEETYALDILASVLGHGRTSRLVQSLREQQGLVSHIHVSNLTYRQQGMFYVSASLPEENLAAVEAAIATHIRDLQQHPVTSAELERVRTRVANHFTFGTETPSDRAGLYGYYQSLLADLHHALYYPEKLHAIDVPTLQAAAQQYLAADAYGIVVIRPASTP